MIPELFQVFIIIGNVVGWLAIYYLVDRKIDKKVAKYWKQIRESEEGQDLFALVKETKNLIQSEQTQKLFAETHDLLADFRAILKMLRERAENTQDEADDSDRPVLPKLE